MTETAEKRWRVGLYFILAGLSIGWLVGLSASPVLAPVLGALVGALAGLVAGARVTTTKGILLDPAPVAWTLVGMAVAAPFGILVRTQDWLGPGSDGAIHIAELGSNEQRAGTAALFTQASGLCARLDRSTSARFRDSLRTSSLPWAPVLEREIAEDARLQELVEAICSEYSSD